MRFLCKEYLFCLFLGRMVLYALKWHETMYMGYGNKIMIKWF